MQNMRLQVVGALDQVAHDAAVFRYLIFQAKGFIQRMGCRNGMGNRANAADLLDVFLCIPGIAALQDQLQAAEEGTGALCLNYFAAVNLALYF